MTAEHWRQLKAILADALEHSDSERQAFVENACGSEAGLVAEALAFLSYAEETADALWFGGRFAIVESTVRADEAGVAIAPAAIPARPSVA
jgi:hypothetical protein